jgi:hypothetical protein
MFPQLTQRVASPLTSFCVQNATVVPSGKTICVSRAYGTMLGQNVTVVSSGINPQSSAMCTLELLNCASHIKDFIYAGTSGFSAAVSGPHLMPLRSICRSVTICRCKIAGLMQVGGIINPTDCMEAAAVETITRVGDVCVTPFSNNW